MTAEPYNCGIVTDFFLLLLDSVILSLSVKLFAEQDSATTIQHHIGTGTKSESSTINISKFF